MRRLGLPLFMSVKHAISFGGCFFLSLLCWSQVVFRQLEDVWRYAESHHPQILQAQYQKQLAEIQVKTASAPLLPSVSLNGQFTNNWELPTTLLPAVIFGGKPNEFKPVQFGVPYVWTGNASLQWDLVNISSWLNAKIAQEQNELAGIQVGKITKQACDQLASVWCQLLLLQNAIELSKKQRVAADSLFFIASERNKKGLISELQFIPVQINQLRAHQADSLAENQYHIQLNGLKFLLGMALGDSLTIDASLPDVTFSDGSPFRRDPLIKESEQQVLVSQTGLRQSQSLNWPTLSFISNVGWQQNNQQFKPFDSGVPWYPSKYYGLKVSMPVFAGGSRYQTIQRNRLTLHWQERQATIVANQCSVTDANLLLQQQAAWIEKETTVEILTKYHWMFEAQKKAYVAGIASLEEVNKSLSDYLNYSITYYNAIANYALSVYKIQLRQRDF